MYLTSKYILSVHSFSIDPFTLLHLYTPHTQSIIVQKLFLDKSWLLPIYSVVFLTLASSPFRLNLFSKQNGVQQSVSHQLLPCFRSQTSAFCQHFWAQKKHRFVVISQCLHYFLLFKVIIPPLAYIQCPSGFSFFCLFSRVLDIAVGNSTKHSQHKLLHRMQSRWRFSEKFYSLCFFWFFFSSGEQTANWVWVILSVSSVCHQFVPDSVFLHVFSALVHSVTQTQSKEVFSLFTCKTFNAKWAILLLWQQNGRDGKLNQARKKAFLLTWMSTICTSNVTAVEVLIASHQ